MVLRNYLALSAVVGFMLGACSAWGAAGDITLSVPAQSSEIVLQTCSRFSGAVCSISYRGKEHIDTRDHGRLLQSASSFDGYGECYNPTEGGAERDSWSSTSMLKAARAENNQIWTLTDMAFWLRPLQSYRRGYGRFIFPDVVNWNCVFRENNVNPGTYSYRCLLVVGSVAEVQDTLRRLHQNRQDLQKPPIHADK